MKKLAVSVAVLSAISSFSTLATEFDLSHDNQKETSIKVHHELLGGLGGGIEFVGIDNLKRHKETTFTVDYKADFGNFYLKPSFDLTLPSTHTKEVLDVSHGTNRPGSEYSMANYKLGNTSKLGIKGGYLFESGLYTAARYRYEMSDGKGGWHHSSKVTTPPSAIVGKVKHTANIHRVDLTVGYNLLDTVDLSANYIMKRGTTEGEVKVSGEKGTNKDKFNAKTNELELTAVLTALGDFKPYAQYTYKGDTKYSGLASAKLKSEDVYKIGVKYVF